MVKLFGGAAIAIVATLAAAAQPALADDATYDYVVQKGDTCTSIAKHLLGGAAGIDIIHKLNPGLGPQPHNLKPGLVLKLPRAEQKPDAKLTDTRGAVKVRKPDATDWANGVLGTDLFRAWRVNTEQKASAQVTFVDKSQIELREDTVVIIYGPDAADAQQSGVTAQLESGTLRSKMGQLGGARVTTPSSEIRVAGGSTLVTVDHGKSIVANHAGGAVQVRALDAKKKPSGAGVKVAVGMGTRVIEQKPPEPPRPLPPSPVWSSPAARELTTGHAALVASWAPVATAEHYRIEIKPPTGDPIVVQVPAGIAKLELPNAQPGRYEAVIAAIDHDGFESIPSAPLPIDVIQIAATDGFPLGGKLDAPPGMTCAIDHGAASAAPVIASAGKHVVRCNDGGAGGEATLAFETPPVALSIRSDHVVTRASPTELDIVISPMVAGKVNVTSDELAFEYVRPMSDGVIAAVEVPRGRPGGAAYLKVAIDEGTGAPPIPLGVVEVGVEALPPPPPIAPPRFELDAFAGAVALGTSLQLGKAPTAGFTPSGTMFALGGRASARIYERLGGEVELAVGGPTYLGEPGTPTVYDYGAHVWLTVVDENGVELRAIAGAGAQTLVPFSMARAAGVVTDTEPGGTVGAALRYQIGRGFGLRADGRGDLVPARGGGVTVIGEVFAGALYEF